MVAGTLITAPCTVAIRIVDPDNPSPLDNQEMGRDRKKFFSRRMKDKEEKGGSEKGDKEMHSDIESASPRRPPWKKVSLSGSMSPKGRESESGTGIEMDQIYDSRNKTSASNGNPTPFLDNLMRKTSGSVKKSTSNDL
jgi:hypothetical protein